MTLCPACGEPNLARASFCLACGTPLPSPDLAVRPARKTVTVVFTDVAESGGLGERLDPESLSLVVAGWFDHMRALFERHGARVQKFVGAGDAGDADHVAGQVAQLIGQVAQLIGLEATPFPAEEAAWAFRRLLEVLAGRGPLVVVLDDLHWAEPTLLDLVEHVADFARASPILLVAIARPELLEQRPGWAGGKLNATTVLLEPLGEAESAELLDRLAGPAALPEAARRGITRAAEGNPLFLEELLAALVEEGRLRREDGRRNAAADLATLGIPPSIQALLTARLGRLDDADRGRPWPATAWPPARTCSRRSAGAAPSPRRWPARAGRRGPGGGRGRGHPAGDLHAGRGCLSARTRRQPAREGPRMSRTPGAPAGARGCSPAPSWSTPTSTTTPGCRRWPGSSGRTGSTAT